MENSNMAVKNYGDQDHLCSMQCISWSIILFGGLIAIALSFLFSIFSLSIGLTAFPIDPDGKVAFAAWGFVGLVIIAIATMFVSGWITGFLGRSYCHRRNLGELYGFGAWALALLGTIFIAAQSGSFLSQKSYLVDRSISTFQLTNTITHDVNQASNLAKGTTSVEAKNAATTLGLTGFATFFILFIGALSAAFGGRLGMEYKKCDRIKN